MPNLLRLTNGIAYLDDWPEEGKCHESTCGLALPHSHETWRYEQAKPPVVPWLPATLSFVAALLAFGGLQVYSVIVGSWRWSISGLVVLFVGLLIGSCLQSYANRRAR